MKMSQWARENFCTYRKSTIRDVVSDLISPTTFNASSTQSSWNAIRVDHIGISFNHRILRYFWLLPQVEIQRVCRNKRYCILSWSYRNGQSFSGGQSKRLSKRPRLARKHPGNTHAVGLSAGGLDPISKTNSRGTTGNELSYSWSALAYDTKNVYVYNLF